MPPAPFELRSRCAPPARGSGHAHRPRYGPDLRARCLPSTSAVARRRCRVRRAHRLCPGARRPLDAPCPLSLVPPAREAAVAAAPTSLRAGLERALRGHRGFRVSRVAIPLARPEHRTRAVGRAARAERGVDAALLREAAHAPRPRGHLAPRPRSGRTPPPQVAPIGSQRGWSRPTSPGSRTRSRSTRRSCRGTAAR